MSISKKGRKKGIKWLIVIFLIILISIFTSNGKRVESWYSTGFYGQFAKLMRSLFGWIPFSLGDILYFLAGCWIIWKIIKNIILLFRAKFREAGSAFLHFLWILCCVYIVFSIFWGINYNRRGIMYQLHLSRPEYDTSDLITLQKILLEKVNTSKMVTLRKHELYPSTGELIERAQAAYKAAARLYPFLDYKNVSVKSSLYGNPGNYLGFTGYYNPFTGEAQINTTVPKFLQPYIATHEMAHQLGYAKENAANFVGYLAAVHSTDTLFHYSTYLDLFLYTNREVFYFDSLSAQNAIMQLDPSVKEDLVQLRKFNEAHKSFIEPAITWMYGNYLKMNKQPQGMHTYNAVVAMLMAYYKQFGEI